jgi:hypothetical protein
MNSQPPSASPGRYWPVLLLAAIVATTAVLAYYRSRPPVREKVLMVAKLETSSPQIPTPFIMPGIQVPPVVKAEDANLDDDDEMICVAVEGHPRAYLVKAFHATNAHVVNDLLGDIPVTVTYCNLCKTAKAFTDPKRGNPLDIKLGGFAKGMLLYASSVFYHQETMQPYSKENARPFPHPALPFEISTWKAWRQRYPDTEVYLSAPVVEAK